MLVTAFLFSVLFWNNPGNISWCFWIVIPWSQTEFVASRKSHFTLHLALNNLIQSSSTSQPPAPVKVRFDECSLGEKIEAFLSKSILIFGKLRQNSAAVVGRWNIFRGKPKRKKEKSVDVTKVDDDDDDSDNDDDNDDDVNDGTKHRFPETETPKDKKFVSIVSPWSTLSGDKKNRRPSLFCSLYCT